MVVVEAEVVAEVVVVEAEAEVAEMETVTGDAVTVAVIQEEDAEVQEVIAEQGLIVVRANSQALQRTPEEISSTLTPMMASIRFHRLGVIFIFYPNRLASASPQTTKYRKNKTCFI